MSEYRYILEKGSKKYYCPQCGKKTFVRYVDTVIDDYLPEQYGRCDRESNCAYALNPYADGYCKNIWLQENECQTTWQPQQVKKVKNMKPKKTFYFYPDTVLQRTCSGYEQNVFIQNLLTNIAFPFNAQDIEKVVSLYYLGTIKNGLRAGATTFPFIDIQGNIRAIQAKQFDNANHTTSTDFLHSIIERHCIKHIKSLPEWLINYQKNELKVSCLFGEHLLNKYPNNSIGLVEAPKTAIYSTLYFGIPDDATNLLWLAVYNLSSLNLDKCKALQNRNVYLFPDLSKDGQAFELWKNKAVGIQKKLNGSFVKVVDLLERLATNEDKDEGKDLADYLIRTDWRNYRNGSSSLNI